MTELVVHSVVGSPYGRAVLAALFEKGASFRFATVAGAAMKAQEHLSRHAFGRVPVIEHNGFVLYETQAILRYIDRVFPDPALTPADPQAAARMDQVMNICDWYLFHGVGNVIGFQRIVGPMLMGLTPDEAVIAAALPQANQVFKELARLLGDQPFFAGEAVSLADLIVAPQMDFLAVTPEWGLLTKDILALGAWLDRMRARPSFQATTWEKVAELAKAD